MSGAGFRFTSDVLKRLALGSHPGEVPSELGWSNPDGGMFVTMADMKLFLQFLGGGEKKFLSDAMRREWFMPRAMLPDGVSGFGMPWEIVQSKSKDGIPTGQWLYTKAGNVDRFGCGFRCIPFILVVLLRSTIFCLCTRLLLLFKLFCPPLSPSL